MISVDHFAANFKLTADLYNQIEQIEAERDAVAAKNAELHQTIDDRDAKIAELELEISRIERGDVLTGNV